MLTRKDRIFLFRRALQKTLIGINLCILVDYIIKHPKICSINVLKKRFLGWSQIVEFFATTRNDRIFLFPRALPETYWHELMYFS